MWCAIDVLSHYTSGKMKNVALLATWASCVLHFSQLLSWLFTTVVLFFVTVSFARSRTCELCPACPILHSVYTICKRQCCISAWESTICRRQCYISARESTICRRQCSISAWGRYKSILADILFISADRYASISIF